MADAVDIYISVRSKLPRKGEVALWTDKKILSYLAFFERFVENGRIKVTNEKRANMEVDCLEQEFWPEFMARIDVPSGATYGTIALFQQRLITFSRIVLSYLKTNPHAITDEIAAAMEKNPRCHWALELFRLKKGIIGVETVQGSDLENTSQYQPNQRPELSTTKRPEVIFNDSLIRMTSILKELTKSIKREDLKKMATEDKLKQATSLMKVVGGLVRKYVPNRQVFQQININSAKREDLEKSFMQYADLNLRESEE